jgi:copper resistance protein D
MTPDIAMAACRFLHDAAAMTLWGAFAYLGTLVPSRLSKLLAERLRVVRWTAIAFVTLTALAVLPIEAALIGNGWTDALDRQMLFDVVGATGVGKAWLVQMAAAIVLVAAQAARSGWRTVATAAASGVVLAVLASGGHAVMQDGWLGIAHQLNDMVHVLSAGAWFGALLPLVITLSMLGKPPFNAQASTALRRFSTAGHVVVALTILSGVANSLFIIGLPIGWSTPYRIMLAAKIAVVLMMTILAATNRYWFVPRISRAGASAIHAIRRGTCAEIALGLVAILLVSIFGMLDPN